MSGTNRCLESFRHNIPHYSTLFFLLYANQSLAKLYLINLVIWSCICKTAFEYTRYCSFRTSFVCACWVLLDWQDGPSFDTRLMLFGKCIESPSYFTSPFTVATKTGCTHLTAGVVFAVWPIDLEATIIEHVYHLVHHGIFLMWLWKESILA